MQALFCFVYCCPKPKHCLAQSRYSINICWMNEWVTKWTAGLFIQLFTGHIYLNISQTGEVQHIPNRVPHLYYSLLQTALSPFSLSEISTYPTWLPKSETWAPCLISSLCFHPYLIGNEVFSILTPYISRTRPPACTSLLALPWLKILSLLSWVIVIVD